MYTKKEKRSILIAMCIGDGHIHKCLRSKSASLKIQHSIKQKDWITTKYDWTISLLGGFKPTLKEFNNSGYPRIRFQKAHRYFRVLRKWLYHNNDKIITRKILNYLDLRGLAIWYMDDGGLSAKKINDKIHAYEMFLNTHETKENNQVIIDYFKEVWGIQWTQVKNKGSYRLRMGTKEAKKFTTLIEPYIIPSMQYKINFTRASNVSTRDDDIV